MKKNESKENHEQEIKIFLPSSDEVKKPSVFRFFQGRDRKSEKRGAKRMSARKLRQNWQFYVFFVSFFSLFSLSTRLYMSGSYGKLALISSDRLEVCF